MTGSSKKLFKVDISTKIITLNLYCESEEFCILLLTKKKYTIQTGKGTITEADKKE